MWNMINKLPLIDLFNGIALLFLAKFSCHFKVTWLHIIILKYQIIEWLEMWQDLMNNFGNKVIHYWHYNNAFILIVCRRSVV